MMLQHILETFNELTVLNNRDGEVTQVKMRTGARVGARVSCHNGHARA